MQSRAFRSSSCLCLLCGLTIIGASKRAESSTDKPSAPGAFANPTPVRAEAPADTAVSSVDLAREFAKDGDAAKARRGFKQHILNRRTGSAFFLQRERSREAGNSAADDGNT